MDNALNIAELSEFILKTNGNRPPRSVLQQIVKTFSPSRMNDRLTLEGFMEFYLQQTLDEPSETRKDLETHGFDPKSLTKKGPG